MAQAVCRWPHVVKARVRSQDSPYEIYGGQSGTRTGFSLDLFCFSLTLPFHQCSTPIFIYTLLLSEGQTDEAWEPSKKQCSFGKHWIEECSVFKGLKQIFKLMTSSLCSTAFLEDRIIPQNLKVLLLVSELKVYHRATFELIVAVNIHIIIF